MYSYNARVTGDDGKRFTLEMPKPLRTGQTVTSGRGGEYRVAYVYKDGRAKVAILVRPGGKKKPGRPKKT